MKELILLKSGEIMLKGLNRSMFENRLMKNTKLALKGLGSFNIYKSQSTFYVEPEENSAPLDFDAVIGQLKKVFGYAGLSRCCVVEKDFRVISATAIEYLRPQLTKAKTFKVLAKRSDKTFPMDSMDISRELGGDILESYPNLTVDVHNPELQVIVEIREKGAYIHTNQLPGAGGLPVGTSGNGMLLLSGGIDSPVAAYMMAKRGIRIFAVHFESPPYTSPRALQKVEDLCEKISKWSGPVKLYTVPFTKPQEDMKRNCPESYITLIMRRLMMRVSEELSANENCEALITGECVGQVASQTLKALACTDNAVKDLPVLRPLVGMDKNEIMAISRFIDTYETSILPYEDCCTVFTPKRPKTNPSISEVIEAEKSLNVDGIVKECVENVSFKLIS